jgi:nitrogen fixation/metabolism regulation signal transduction histidine kinase
MVFNRFAISVVLRVVILAVTIFAFSCLIIVFRDRHILFIILFLLLLTVIEITSLIHYVLHTNRQVTRFLVGLKNADFTVKFSGQAIGRSFNELADIMNQTVETLRELRLERETQIHLLKIITADIKTGILSVNNSGKIVLMNYKAQKLLDVPEEVKTWGELRAINPSFAKVTDSLQNEGNTFTEIKVRDEIRKISLNLNTIPLLDEKIRVITIEDIQNQVELRESDAWLKLTRILMHEIMNSVTPLTSLTETIGNILLVKTNTDKFPGIAKEDMDDIKFCLENIRKRKNHLMSFIENYRRLAHLPPPTKKLVSAYDLVTSVVSCLQTELCDNHVEISIGRELQSKKLWADASQIEQVLINLIKNSVYALHNTENKKIEISGTEKDQYIVVQVTDNGEGIPADKLNDIFIPFYSTKENGSGVGLGISRQIMLAHKGSIRVQSKPNSGSTFSLWFPNPSSNV